MNVKNNIYYFFFVSVWVQALIYFFQQKKGGTAQPSSRIEELTRQLKAVEDAIAQRKSKKLNK